LLHEFIYLMNKLNRLIRGLFNAVEHKQYPFFPSIVGSNAL